MATQSPRIALAGNPNVGKSTLFNALTGARQHVGNWPGKTVEKKEGRFTVAGRDLAVVDLPGTYSLAACSVEEMIARDFLLNERPDAVVAVVDAANLERNLFLVVQLLELHVPLILALNMADTARRRGMTIDAGRLSAGLGGVPVIETVGNRSIGLDALKQAIRGLMDGAQRTPVRLDYGAAIEPELAGLQAQIEATGDLARRYHPRWLALKLLENDEALPAQVAGQPGGEALLAQARAAAGRIEADLGEDAETLITDRRYGFIARVVQGAVTRSAAAEARSDRVDRLVTHRVWGLPIFLLLMWLVFQVTANVSAPYVAWVDGVIGGPVTRGAAALLAALGLSETWLAALLLDGVIAGVGGVLVFVPVLLSLYMAIAILEDSGYMARAAFVMDRLMRVIGLHGKSFLPLLVGFGCTVPAVYATRTLENERDRRLTAFLATFMSCGARLPVYAVFGAAFFGPAAGNLIFGLYGLGILIALATGFAARRTLYRHLPPPPFVMELPPYRLPEPRGVLRQMWERTGEFVRKAGTVILACSVIIWLLMATPARPDAGAFNAVPAEDSLFGAVSRAIAPVLAPAGFGQWQAAGALLTGFVAKEVVIGTMSQVYAGGAADAGPAAAAPTAGEELAGIVTSFGAATALTVQEAVNIVPRTVNLIPLIDAPEIRLLPGAADDDNGRLAAALTAAFSPLAAVAFNVFVLLYVPCMTATAAIRHEFGARLMALQIVYTAVIAWAMAVLVYQLGRLLWPGG